MASTYRITIHQDKNNNLVITSNPTVWAAPNPSEFQPDTLVNDNNIDEQTKLEILDFLETFFKLYPNATKNELDYYMMEDVLPIISQNFIYSELVNPIIQKKEKQYLVKIAVRYLDNETKIENISQYQLTLEKKDNWKIIMNE